MVSIVLLFLVAISISTVKAEFIQGSVYVTEGRASFLNGTLDKYGSAAYGTYNDTMTTTGWGVLNIRAGFGNRKDNHDMMYAAGFFEGMATATRIIQHYDNIFDAFLKQMPESFMAKLDAFFMEQEEWARAMVKKDNDQTPLWRHVGYILAQFDGLMAGCQTVATVKPIKRFMLQLLNSIGDVIDLKYALDPSLRPNFKNMTDGEFTKFVQTHGHCSALFKILPGLENIYMSHSSWFVYGAMLRIYKHYDFNLQDEATAAKGLSFSSYPAFLESLDDFYLMSNGLVLIQTTNNVFNHDLYDLVKPQTLPAWVRVRVANHMSKTAPDWGKIFKQYNSGTYNNQYMVLDLNKVQLNTTVEDNAFWVVEQIPGFVEYADQTSILRNGHWSSYNVPFYENIFNQSGYPDIVKRRGLDNSYMLAPRAKIFRRDADSVSDMRTMKNIMRYNDYKHDKYSDNDACKTICCRGDLRSDMPSLDGCYDTKVADYFMATRRQAYAINGPSIGTGLPPFSWRDYQAKHEGMPETFNFDYQFMRPENL